MFKNPFKRKAKLSMKEVQKCVFIKKRIETLEQYMYTNCTSQTDRVPRAYIRLGEDYLKKVKYYDWLYEWS